ncbi:hypothetical protein ILUMI_20755 [Ignelater luminosus]|uniref:Uncharacterized protein n=1 Tax=Ignelater luminosus TaxID=2038154 RepID=A0A8K0CDH7_IGNLU|nr:hypothetical protein ILUMI_20755 [Ignelater luminosus]
MTAVLKVLFLLNNIILIIAAKSDSVFNYDVMTNNFYLQFFQNEYHIIPHHLDVVRYNRNFVDLMHIRTFKHNRTCTAFNFTVRSLMDKSEKIEVRVILQAYKFLSNEYRLFPMRFEVNLCKAIDVNVLGLLNTFKFLYFFFDQGKTYNVCNWIVDERKFPPGIPTGKYKFQLIYQYYLEEVLVVDGYADIVNSWFIF